MAGLGVLMLALATAVGCGGVAEQSSAAQSSAAPTSDPPVVATDVGALFSGSLSAGSTCSAGVVNSPSGEVIVSAAHCISGSGVGLLFAPAYADGVAPYGTWVVTAAYADPSWLAEQVPSADVAFLLVAPVPGSSTRTVQSVVGGGDLTTAPTAGQQITVAGYIAGDTTQVACSATVYLADGYPAFDCDGFQEGTSGSPWLTVPDTDSDVPQVTGVIGGLDQGGCTDGTSYTAPFTNTTQAVYARAAAGAAPDVLPTPDPDGC